MRYYYDVNGARKQTNLSFHSTVLLGLYPNSDFILSEIDLLDLHLQGAAEAGFFPGVIFYLTLWYIRRDQAFRMAMFFSGAMLAGAFGGILLSITC